MTTEQNDRWLEVLRMAYSAPTPEEINEAMPQAQWDSLSRLSGPSSGNWQPSRQRLNS